MAAAAPVAAEARVAEPEGVEFMAGAAGILSGERARDRVREGGARARHGSSRMATPTLQQARLQVNTLPLSLYTSELSAGKRMQQAETHAHLCPKQETLVQPRSWYSPGSGASQLPSDPRLTCRATPAARCLETKPHAQGLDS